MRDSIPTIPELYEIGRDSLAKYPKRLPYGEVRKLAAETGLSEEWFRKSRQLATRFKDRRPLDRILAFCKRNGHELTAAHLLVLLPVPAAKWEALLTRAVKAKWSLGKLKSMILRKQGAKNLVGGRKRRKPETKEDAYMELQRFQRGWRGLIRSLQTAETEDLRADLSPAIRGHLKRLDAEMEKLSQRCARVLEKPRRNRR